VWRRLREQQNPGTIQIENFVTLFLEKNWNFCGNRVVIILSK
jgi:hypothetical protein